MIRELAKHRDLVWLLTVREVRIRYARAALGMSWALFVPVAQMLVFTMLGFGRLIETGSAYGEVPYSVFAYLGILPWTHFAASMTMGTPSLVIAANMLKKSAFPREAVPLAKVFAAGFDLLIGSSFAVILLLGNGIPIHPSILAVPLILILQVSFTIGLVLLTSSGNMFFRDVNYLVSVVLLLAMFATSVLYPVTVTNPPWVAELLALNPMSSFLDAYREAVLLGRWPWSRLVPGFCGAVASLALGAFVFRRLAPRFAEEV